MVEESKLPNRITRATDDADKHFKKLLNWRNKINNGQIANIFLCELGVYFFLGERNIQLQTFYMLL